MNNQKSGNTPEPRRGDAFFGPPLCTYQCGFYACRCCVRVHYDSVLAVKGQEEEGGCGGHFGVVVVAAAVATMVVAAVVVDVVVVDVVEVLVCISLPLRVPRREKVATDTGWVQC